jgi:hypothetical protein
MFHGTVVLVSNRKDAIFPLGKQQVNHPACASVLWMLYAGASVGVSESARSLSSASLHQALLLRPMPSKLIGHQHSRPLLSILVLLDKTDHQPAELCGLFEIHNVPHVLDYHTARPRYSSFDRACMRMNIRDIGVSHEH